MDYGFLIRSILLQVIVFCSVPFIYWLLKRRKAITFLNYVGLSQPKKSGATVTIAAFLLIYIVVYGVTHFIPAISALTQPSANAYAGLEVAAIIPALLVGFIQQGFSEEVLFRGFVSKRFYSTFGFNCGNAAQAFIFGMIHVLLSISKESDVVSYLVIFTCTALAGWLLGYLDEKLYSGSIFPSILLHGLGNFIMVITVAF